MQVCINNVKPLTFTYVITYFIKTTVCFLFESTYVAYNNYITVVKTFKFYTKVKAW